ncbi:histidinol dehydrogenase [Deferribacter autotrophicus]|uniref:Histidinol dehydrogenase n=1 Tax=Deferribacter autotrophicus TaxID=500465 RepID=A0A5A8F2T6_9BACT|nr:histidinol dehydrogenase [Deferribacter autotrophicus]KAA0257717.1 histidinol dehydrogenase [Deferribacter autotrophicus]
MIFYPDSEKIEKILNRGEIFEEKYLNSVIEIIQKVKKEGDRALIKLTKKFDNYDLEKKFYFERSELKTFYEKIPENLKVAFNRAKDNIEFFHQAQLEKTFLVESNGAVLGQKITPLEKVGIYVPGGKASYPSTVLMNAVPAKVAGVDKVYMMSPTSGGEINELVLGVAYLAGVDRVYLVGGAQAIAAFAYGTESVEKVDKIVGPGNIYVALAKKMVFGTVDIDMIAGPSEILILADDSADPTFVAADMLSQAEHDELASAITITDNEDLAKEIEQELISQLFKLERRSIAEKSLKEFGGILLVKNLEEGIDFVNKIAPEHFELCVRNPFEYLYKIKNAGAIFMGHYTPEAVGDYFAGPNHTLPTGGSARFFSPLGTYDFIKRSSIIQCSLGYLTKFGKNIMDMADSEGLTAHRDSVKYRMLNGFKTDI